MKKKPSFTMEEYLGLKTFPVEIDEFTAEALISAIAIYLIETSVTRNREILNTRTLLKKFERHILSKMRGKK